MIIKIFGPVGSGKSTVSKYVAYVLGLEYIPEVEENDIKFFRLLNKRNHTQSSKDKMDFQCYTFEQAYYRQYGKTRAVIDTPIDQHYIMARCSLNSEEMFEYKNYYSDYLRKIYSEKDVEVINIVLHVPFEETLRRISSRGRSEELMSKEEIEFYKNFYDKLFIEKMYPEGSIIIDNIGDPEDTVREILKKILGLPPRRKQK